jgi:colanic acid/amylovoran biosynthesis glycosyltransferase
VRETLRKDADPSKRKVVVHFKAGPYLPITENWVYTQISNLKSYEPVVYSVGTENLDLFPTKRIRSFVPGAVAHEKSDPTYKKWTVHLSFYRYFLFSLLKDRPATIHAHFGPSGYGFLSLKRLFRIPMITTFYGYDLNQLPLQHPEWGKRYKALFQFGDLFLTEGTHMRENLIKLGCPDDKVVVQHIGVDTEKIRFVPRTFGPDGAIRLLMSASFREKKGIPYGVEAFGRFKESHPGTKVNLTIIGDSAGDASGEAQKRLIMNGISRYHLEESVTMMGYQPYPVFLEELYRHHLLLAPSVHASDGDTEGGAPVSLIEASASGMPVLATTHCDIPEVILDGESGLLTPERNAEALAEKLENLISAPSLLAEMGLKGRRHIEKNYAIDTQIRRLEEIYDGILRRHVESSH